MLLAHAQQMYAFTNAEAAAVVARMTTAPTATRKRHIDTLVGSLKTAGVWSKLNVLYLFAAHNSQAARLNWIADNYTASPSNSPAFTVDRGYAGDGFASYVDSGFAPDVLNQNSIAFCAYTQNGSSSSSVAGCFSSAASSGVSLSARTSGNMSVRVNQGSITTSTSGLVGADTGLYACNRSSASDIQAYWNGTQTLAATVASVAPISTTLAFGYMKGSLTYNNMRFAAGAVGANLSAGEHAALYNAINTYLQAVGAA